MSDFGKDCTNCRTCVDACPFLKEFGTPLKIVEEEPQAVFLWHVLPLLQDRTCFKTIATAGFI